MDYSEFYNADLQQNTQNENSNESKNAMNTGEMTIEDVRKVFERMNGWNPVTGQSKVAISYQLFAMDDPENSQSRNQVFSTCKPAIQMNFDSHIPGYFGLDIIFRSANEPELKLLWGRLQQFKRSTSVHPEKEWIFFMNILESSSISLQTEKEDTPFVIRAFNPLLTYLTREVPEMQVDDTESTDGEMIGGNIIRMIIPAEFVQFEYCSDIDTLGTKGEVLALEEESRYYSCQNSQGENW